MFQRNGSYKATIVVQTNGMGMPGLVTAKDKIYMVLCDYKKMGEMVEVKTFEQKVKWVQFKLLCVYYRLYFGLLLISVVWEYQKYRQEEQ